MFAASKAFAIADSIIKIQQAMASAAMSQPFPLNLAAIGSVVAATSSIVSTIFGTQYGGGRQYGGPVSAGSLYRVNETGRPEMFTASNGNQFLLPTAGGDVTAADKVGAGGGWTVNVYNAPPGTTATVNDENRIINIAVAQPVNTTARQLRANSGVIWDAAQASTNIRSRL